MMGDVTPFRPRKPLPKSLPPPFGLSVPVQALWAMSDGGPPTHIEDLWLNPQMRKEVVDRRNLDRVLRKLRRAHKTEMDEWFAR
jgi:hypothetical protein